MPHASCASAPPPSGCSSARHVPCWFGRPGGRGARSVTDDPDLRSRLERIASSAGDPPEHGLERVTARRHRRLRRRRGAVATAAVLAVLAVGRLADRSEGLADDPRAVTASETATPDGAPAEVPRIVEVRCEPTGIVVPVASVRPQRDGLHMLVVHNSLPSATASAVTSAELVVGAIPVPPGGDTRCASRCRPAQLTIGCDIAGGAERRLVDLVDPVRLLPRARAGLRRAEPHAGRSCRLEIHQPEHRHRGPAVRRGPHLVGRRPATRHRRDARLPVPAAERATDRPGRGGGPRRRRDRVRPRAEGPTARRAAVDHAQPRSTECTGAGRALRARRRRAAPRPGPPAPRRRSVAVRPAGDARRH